MIPRPRLVFAVLAVLTLSLTGWIYWGPWPDPSQVATPWKPDAILILGGGDGARIRQGGMLAGTYPDVPLLVTGDGGDIVKGLVAAGIPVTRIIHEEKAESTYENALLTRELLDRINARHVLLVTNWFHVPRALAVFRHEQPAKNFEASFEVKPFPVTPWDVNSQRRERLAAVLYLFRHGIWSW